ncbi:hypothetical protein LEN26_016330 [Aphanomyces euteiches]|nr:hypothetical protein LEN26_016330 [Aphanomyces euteiches]KAH9122456.1 hypothetical protein AeMF1_006270 [Aphanomyces euteiches]KAH9181784.1 hypothetical protein AeNC1_016241 [Aphanomyces euteiches]
MTTRLLGTVSWRPITKVIGKGPYACLEVRDIKFGSPEYEAAVQLREEVLRKPLAMRYNREDLAKEHSDIHIGVFFEDLIVASVMLRPEQPIAWMKQVAVNPTLQRKGLGRILMQGFEARARAENFTEIHLHARETAVPFYEKLGYTIVSEQYEEVGLPHRSMFKSLE